MLEKDIEVNLHESPKQYAKFKGIVEKVREEDENSEIDNEEEKEV
jgi:hypothetical protein